MNSTIKEASCELSFYPGKRIIRSLPKGLWNKEYTLNNIEDIKNMAKEFNGNSWAFIGLIEFMEPIQDADTARAFAKFHEELESAKCNKIVFVVGKALTIKTQSKRHQEKSNAEGITIDYVKTEEEALELLNNDY